MSFSIDTKNELARTLPTKKCCMLAEISGFIRTKGSIGLSGFGKFKIIISTENPAIARHYKKLLQDYFDIDTKLEITDSNAIGKNRANSKYLYSITIDENNRSEQILRECGILLIREGNNYISDGIYSGIVKSKCCKKAYLRGVFLGTGTVNDPAKSYNLEFVLDSEDMANDLKKLINSFSDLSSKVIKRGKKYIVYIKKADYISDILAIMGANSTVLNLEEIRIQKSMVARAKRNVNCDSANTDKTVNASTRQIEAIKKIENKMGLSYLPEKLREVAMLRLQNPYISLVALGEMCEPPLKKSGINNRLKRIEEIANKI